MSDFKTPVRKIVKSPTYGNNDDWQTCSEFRREAMKVAANNDLDEDLCEEVLDDVVRVLEIMGIVVLSEF